MVYLILLESDNITLGNFTTRETGERFEHSDTKQQKVAKVQEKNLSRDMLLQKTEKDFIGNVSLKGQVVNKTHTGGTKIISTITAQYLMAP